jgi:hypothetical protein
MGKKEQGLPLIKWEGDEAKDEAPRPVGSFGKWPGPGEPISDDVARKALECDRLDVVARYLRETIVPLIRNRERGRIHQTDTLYMLADMLDRNAALPWHLKRCSTRGKPANHPWRDLEIGARVQRLIDDGIPRKAAVADVCGDSGYKQSTVKSAYEKYLRVRELGFWHHQPLMCERSTWRKRRAKVLAK